MKRIITLLLAATLILSNFVNIKAADEKTYPPFIEGYTDGTFRPEGNMTRAEAVSIFAKLIDDKERKNTNFADVSSEAWYYDSLNMLNSLDMLHSYDEMFEGEKNITRLELAEFIYILKNGYIQSLSREDMFSQLITAGIIKGYEDGSYRQNNHITRAEAVVLVQRALDIKVSLTGFCDFKDLSRDHWAYYNIVAASGSKNQSWPREIPADYYTKEFDVYNEKGSEWDIIPMVNDDLRAKGITIGGEGAQRMNSIAISADGQLLIVGNDTTTVRRSVDGGKTWEHSNRGFYARSAGAFAIDPNNKNFVLGFGAHSKNFNGLYRSEDAGFSWNQVLHQYLGTGQLELRESLCYDASSYDEALGGSAVAYWSKNKWLNPPNGVYADEAEIPTNDDPNEKFGLWKTTDGGKTWFVVNEEMSDSIIKVHPETGVVYASNLNGFFRSEDGGVTFEHILSGSMIYGMDVIATQPDNVYINDYKGVLVSTDSGRSFKRVESAAFPKSVSTENPYASVVNLKVSPANPQNMVISYYSGWNVYKNSKYFSKDGGKTWALSTEDKSKDFFVSNNREAMFVWHPTDENKVWSFGGDWVVSSEDAGKTYTWDYEGGVGVFVDQRTIFNIYNPDIMYYGSQDFHGALTTDGGKNWKHIWKVVNNQWSGFVYGSYAADENTLIALCSTGKAYEGIGSNSGWYGVSEIRVSHDAGETWRNTGIMITDNHRKKWAEMCSQSPKNPEILFAANYRSTDNGETWEKMEVDAVTAFNPYGEKELYACKDAYIMVSYDDGETWQQYCEVKIPEGLTAETVEIWDMAFDGVNNIMYYISGSYDTGEYFCKYENGETVDLTENMIFGDYTRRFQVCAVDPRYTQIVYVGGYNNYVNPVGVQRSCDGGKTFQLISTHDVEYSVTKTGPAGGVSPYDLIVHPTTGELWVPQACAGWMKYPAPYEN